MKFTISMLEADVLINWLRALFKPLKSVVRPSRFHPAPKEEKIKKKVKSEEELKYMMLPVANDVLGTAEKGF